MQGEPFKYFAYGAAARRGRGGRLHRRLPAAPGRHRARRRRQPLAADRPRPDRGRLRAGRGLADPGGPALGHERRPEPRPAGHPGGQHLQAAELLRDARGVQRHLLERATEDGVGLRLQGGRRAAADARRSASGRRCGRRSRRSGRPGTSVDLGCPSTPEAVVLGGRGGAAAGPATVEATGVRPDRPTGAVALERAGREHAGLA